MEVRTAAKYPFLQGASRILKDKGITLNDIVKKMAYDRARFQGGERVKDVIEDLVIEEHPMAREQDAITELVAYPVARMIVSAVADEWLVNRYAIAEGKTASRRLEGEKNAFVVNVASELGIEASPEDGGFSVDFSDFLRYSSRMKSSEWKLINQELKKGNVIVPRSRLIRLVEQALTDKISSDLPLPVNDEIVEAFRVQISEIREMLEEERKRRPAVEMGRLSIMRFPPCMKKLLEMIRAGENVPHSGRFALVAFLHTLGMDSEEILRTFATSPDFDESKSRYQIQHISGETSGTEYTPPECSTMKSYGICFNPDDLCSREWMTHPLTYYRAKGRRRRLGS